MAAATRGRPAILDKAELKLEDGSSVAIRLVGDGKTVQVELPSQWNLQDLSRSVTKTGGRTKVAFVHDAPNGVAKPAPVRKTRGVAKKAAPAKKTAPAAAAKAEKKAPATKARRTRKTAAAKA